MDSVDEWLRPSPVVMKFAQSSELTTLVRNLLQMVIEVLLKVLKSSVISRDCLVVSGIALSAALHACLAPKKRSIFITY